MTKKLIQLATAIIITLTLTHFSSAHAQTASNQCNNTSVDSTCMAPNPQSYTPIDTCNNPYACGTAPTPTTTPSIPTAPTGGSSITTKPTSMYISWGCGGRILANGNHICTQGYLYSISISFSDSTTIAGTYATSTAEGSAYNTLPNCNVGYGLQKFQTSSVNTAQCQAVGTLLTTYPIKYVDPDRCIQAGNFAGSQDVYNCTSYGITDDMINKSDFESDIVPLLKQIFPNNNNIQSM